MKTKEQIIKDIKAGKKSQCIDSRDFERLSTFFGGAEWEVFGFELADDVKIDDIVTPDWTEENIVVQLKKDVEFGFEKALDKRGISAGLMYEVVKMWMWVLDDPLQHFNDDNYAQYGLPLFKAVAVKYKFNNPIDENAGNEFEYSSEC